MPGIERISFKITNVRGHNLPFLFLFPKPGVIKPTASLGHSNDLSEMLLLKLSPSQTAPAINCTDEPVSSPEASLSYGSRDFLRH